MLRSRISIMVFLVLHLRMSTNPLKLGLKTRKKSLQKEVCLSSYVNPIVRNPCSALTQSPNAQEIQDGHAYCRSVHSRFLSHPTSDIHVRCPHSLNPECSPKKTSAGIEFRCTVDVRSSIISTVLLGRSYCRYDLSYCVPDRSFWEPLDKAPKEPLDLKSLNDEYCEALAEYDWQAADERSWDLVKESAAVYATQGAKPFMEDRFVIDEDVTNSTSRISFYAVFDGHAGEFAVNYAQDLLLKNLKNKIAALQKELRQGTTRFSLFSSQKKSICSSNNENLAYLTKGGKINYGPLLHDVVLSTDKNLLDAAKGKKTFSGTTAIIALIEGSRLIMANVGDSRGVMCDFQGNAIQLSFDHKPDDVNEKKRIEDAGGSVIFYQGTYRTGGYLAMSRALGNSHLKRREYLTAKPDVLNFDLAYHKPQFIILACDGLWDVFSNEDAVTFVRGRIDTDRHFGAKSLAIYAYLRGSGDNITVMVINLKKRTWSNWSFGRAKSLRSLFIRPSNQIPPEKEPIEVPQTET